jgi:hypothetical protein
MMDEMEFKTKVKLSLRKERLDRHVKELERELESVREQQMAVNFQLRELGLLDSIIPFLSPATAKRMSKINVVTFADALTLNDWRMPEGIGKKTREELVTVLKGYGLRIPTDRDGR